MTDDAAIDRMEKQQAQEEQLVVEWEKKATLALKAGDEALAQRALARKLEHQKLALTYARELAVKRGDHQSARELDSRVRAMSSFDVARALDELKAKLGIRDDVDDGEITSDENDRGLFGILTPPTKRFMQ